MKKVYKNVTVTVEEDGQDFRSREEKLANMLIEMSDTDIRNALRQVAGRSQKRLVMIARACHGRIYDMLGLGYGSS